MPTSIPRAFVNLQTTLTNLWSQGSVCPSSQPLAFPDDDRLLLQKLWTLLSMQTCILELHHVLFKLGTRLLRGEGGGGGGACMHVPCLGCPTQWGQDVLIANSPCELIVNLGGIASSWSKIHAESIMHKTILGHVLTAADC